MSEARASLMSSWDRRIAERKARAPRCDHTDGRGRCTKAATEMIDFFSDRPGWYCPDHWQEAEAHAALLECLLPANATAPSGGGGTKQ